VVLRNEDVGWRKPDDRSEKEHLDEKDSKRTQKHSMLSTATLRATTQEKDFVPVRTAEPTNAESKEDALDEKWRSCAKPQRALQSQEPRDESIKVCAKLVWSGG
jgi:hypothetical protein